MISATKSIVKGCRCNDGTLHGTWEYGKSLLSLSLQQPPLCAQLQINRSNLNLERFHKNPAQHNSESVKISKGKESLQRSKSGSLVLEIEQLMKCCVFEWKQWTFTENCWNQTLIGLRWLKLKPQTQQKERQGCGCIEGSNTGKEKKKKNKNLLLGCSEQMGSHSDRKPHLWARFIHSNVEESCPLREELWWPPHFRHESLRGMSSLSPWVPPTEPKPKNECSFLQVYLWVSLHFIESSRSFGSHSWTFP